MVPPTLFHWSEVQRQLANHVRAQEAQAQEDAAFRRCAEAKEAAERTDRVVAIRSARMLGRFVDAGRYSDVRGR